MDYKTIQKRVLNKVRDYSTINFNTTLSKDGASLYVKGDVVFFDVGFSSSKEFNFLGGEIIIHKFWIDIAYLELERIICPILIANELVGKSYSGETNMSFYVEKNYKNTLPEKGIKIASEKDIVLVSDLFTKFFREDALPFFEHWHSLPVLYDYIKNKDDEALWDILGQFSPMKKAVIYRLCNDKDALNIINEYYEKQKPYYEEDSNDVDNIRYYNASKELKETLEKTAPIYNTVM